MRHWLILLLLSGSVAADPAKFHLSKSIDTWVELAPHKYEIHLRTVAAQKQDPKSLELEVSLGKLSQRLPLDTVADEANAFSRGEVVVEDFDFDGVKDIGVPSSVGYGGVNIYYTVFRLQAKSGKFVPLPETTPICNPEFDQVNHILITNSRSGPCWYGSDYKFLQGRPWLYRRRNMALLDGLLVQPDVAYLFETLDPKGKVIDAQLSSDSIKISPVKGSLESTVMTFSSPSARGLSGRFNQGEVVQLDRWQEWNGREYCRARSGARTGWLLMDKETVRR